MIVRLLIAFLRGGAALLGGFVLLLALVVLIEHPDFFTCFAFAVIGFLALKGAVALWAWQHALRRLIAATPAEPIRSPLWIGPLRKRQPRRPFEDDSRGGGPQSTTRADNDLSDERVYPAEYTPDTGRRYTRRREPEGRR